MIIQTMSTEASVLCATNVTTNPVTEPTPTLTAPISGADGIIEFNSEKTGGAASTSLKIIPFGVGADSSTFTMYLYGWINVRAVANAAAAGKVDLWVPVLLATFTGCTLDTTQPGLANTLVLGTNFFCSAITLGVGNLGISVEVVSPGHASHEIAHITADIKGFKYAEIRFATGGSATSCNALYSKY